MNQYKNFIGFHGVPAEAEVIEVRVDGKKIEMPQGMEDVNPVHYFLGKDLYMSYAIALENNTSKHSRVWQELETHDKLAWIEMAKGAVSRYNVLRNMHWYDGKLAVIQSKDLPLGVQTYSGTFLDEIVDRMST